MATVLTENIVLSRTRAQDLNCVRKLNCWGSELSDVSVVKRMPNVEVLSLSVNSISTLKDFSHCKNLRELYVRKNNIRNLSDIHYLKNLPKLKSLWLSDNPCAECENYRFTVIKVLPRLEKLDNISVNQEDVDNATIYGIDIPDPEEVSEEKTVDVVATTGKVPEPEVIEETEVTNGRGPEPTHSVLQKTPSGELTTIAETHNSSPPPQLAPTQSSVHQQAFHARVQTLVDHSGRKIKKGNMEVNYDTSGGNAVDHDNRHGSQEQLSRCNSLPEQDGVAAAGDGYHYAPSSESRGSPAELHYQHHNEYCYSDCRSSSGYPSSQRSEKGSPTRLLPKGGKNRNANILSAVLCLIKELDYASLEVVETAIHCRMEELED